MPSYLQSTVDSTIFDGEAVLSILEGVAENSDGYQVAWDFVRGNWEKSEQCKSYFCISEMCHSLGLYIEEPSGLS